MNAGLKINTQAESWLPGLKHGPIHLTEFLTYTGNLLIGGRPVAAGQTLFVLWSLETEAMFTVECTGEFNPLTLVGARWW